MRSSFGPLRTLIESKIYTCHFLKAQGVSLLCKASISPRQPTQHAFKLVNNLMQTYHDPFLAEVQAHVRDALEELREGHPQKPEINAKQMLQNMSTPPNFELGQAALPCHSLAKGFRSSPVKIAQDLAALI